MKWYLRNTEEEPQLARWLNMTVLVWDGLSLATDIQANDGSATWQSSKAWYVTNPHDKIGIVSGVGLLRDILNMREWYINGAIPEEFPSDATKSQLIVIDENGLWLYEGTPHAVCYGHEKIAFGHGKDFAFGALAMGADARQAVLACNQCSLHCGKGVEVYSIYGDTNEKENH